MISFGKEVNSMLFSILLFLLISCAHAHGSLDDSSPLTVDKIEDLVNKDVLRLLSYLGPEMRPALKRLNGSCHATKCVDYGKKIVEARENGTMVWLVNKRDLNLHIVNELSQLQVSRKAYSNRTLAVQSYGDLATKLLGRGYDLLFVDKPATKLSAAQRLFHVHFGRSLQQGGGGSQVIVFPTIAGAIATFKGVKYYQQRQSLKTVFNELQSELKNSPELAELFKSGDLNARVGKVDELFNKLDLKQLGLKRDMELTKSQKADLADKLQEYAKANKAQIDAAETKVKDAESNGEVEDLTSDLTSCKLGKSLGMMFELCGNTDKTVETKTGGDAADVAGGDTADIAGGDATAVGGDATTALGVDPAAFAGDALPAVDDMGAEIGVDVAEGLGEVAADALLMA